MASRIIHLAITDRICQHYPCKDKNRLRLGSILPDAIPGGSSHLKISIANGTQKTYDLTGFRARFLPRMLADDLYLGYYLHLVQDLYFRDFMYRRYHWDPRPLGNVQRLHHDYALINAYVIQKYALSNDITKPRSFEEEPLHQLGSFAVEELLDAVSDDFNSRPTGDIFFFTTDMADEFIAYASEKCEQEIRSLYHGRSSTDENSLAWQRS